MSPPVPPHFLLDALNESIASGAFIDTKIYVFSRREASGLVGSPRQLYCNSHVLSAVPYFSTLFSDRFSEGQPRNINEGFPPESLPYAVDYDYLSDSDLEDGSYSEEEGDDPAKGEEPRLPPRTQDQGAQDCPTIPPENMPQSSGAGGEATNHYGSPRMGKVAVIRDMAAITFEATIYFLYTSEINFAPFSSDPRHGLLPVKARSCDGNETRPPSPSAKSIYRLADKYDIASLGEHAKAYIQENLAHCNIVDEVFSGFSLSFPEMLSLQVFQLVKKVKEESTGNAESDTRRQLREKIASLSRSQLARATDALSMIWTALAGPMDSPAPVPKPTHSTKPSLPSNWHKIQLAVLKSISTGIFIDVQLYAYNAVHDNTPSDPKPFFASSIVIEDLAPAIASQTIGIDSQAVRLVDGLADDYECLSGELLGSLPKGKSVLKYRTEASLSETHEVLVLMSGAWRTWVSLISYVYTDGITFKPLQTSTDDDVPAGNGKTEQYLSCSPRSMYSLAAALGIEYVKGGALVDIKSKLTVSNVAQELFTSFSAGHNDVMEMEIEFFFKNSIEKSPKLLMEHIKRMASGEAPLFSATLGLMYDKLVEKAFTKSSVNVSNPGVPSNTGNENTAGSAFTNQTLTTPSNLNPPPIPAPVVTFPPTPQFPTLTPGPSTVTVPTARLRCSGCNQLWRLEDIFGIPKCPASGCSGKPGSLRILVCELCNAHYYPHNTVCARKICHARFA